MPRNAYAALRFSSTSSTVGGLYAGGAKTGVESVANCTTGAADADALGTGAGGGATDLADGSTGGSCSHCVWCDDIIQTTNATNAAATASSTRLSGFSRAPI